ncbi:MAG TPA: hypothetical protein PKD53_05600 [Chloroflexaceae bacterium]|nr:hypothetical protein [Chloroflexaceae bacterium]
MNLNQTQARNAGIVLIAIGVVAIFNLWWLIPSALLAAGGVAIYRRQKALGRDGEAVQAALWGLGLALLMLVDFLIPGVLLLGGASLLMRGREAEVEQRALRVVGRIGRRRAPAAMPAPQAQPAAPQRVAVVEPRDQATGSETVRLS